jgi:hypothetical protein
MNSSDGNETLPILELNGADTTWIMVGTFYDTDICEFRIKGYYLVLITYTYTDNAFRVDSLKY